MKKLIYVVVSFFIFLATFFIFSSSIFADNLPNGVVPQQGIASAMIPVIDSFTGKNVGETYMEISFWNVGQLSGNSEYAKTNNKKCLC